MEVGIFIGKFDISRVVSRKIQNKYLHQLPFESKVVLSENNQLQIYETFYNPTMEYKQPLTCVNKFVYNTKTQMKSYPRNNMRS